MSMLIYGTMLYYRRGTGVQKGAGKSRRFVASFLSKHPSAVV